MKIQKAQLNYLRIAPRKVRLVANLIKGLPVSEAEALLSLQPRRASHDILKLLESAVANAKNNQRINERKLFIKEIRVDGGPMLKRFSPRAMGRATPIQKKSSHITLVLGEAEAPGEVRFQIVKQEKIKRVKKEIRSKKEKESPKPKAEEKTRVTTEPGFIKRIFRRKSI